MENQKAKLQNRKNRKQNKWGKKGTSKRGKWEKMDLSICILLLFFCFSICFYVAFFCFFSRQKAKKSKTKAKKANRKSKKKQQKCKWTSPYFSHFFPFSLLFCSCVFWILLICFLVFPFVLHFSRFFQVLKNKNKLWFGEHNFKQDGQFYTVYNRRVYNYV